MGTPKAPEFRDPLGGGGGDDGGSITAQARRAIMEFAAKMGADGFVRCELYAAYPNIKEGTLRGRLIEMTHDSEDGSPSILVLGRHRYPRMDIGVTIPRAFRGKQYQSYVLRSVAHKAQKAAHETRKSRPKGVLQSLPTNGKPAPPYTSDTEREELGQSVLDLEAKRRERDAEIAAAMTEAHLTLLPDEPPARVRVITRPMIVAALLLLAYVVVLVLL